LSVGLGVRALITLGDTRHQTGVGDRPI
jgi:hypothetical protein